ncbi:hypothetical protein MMC27_007171, partial [Xylographa pallens]|nr:hypothetical protein [Xylographa pallens]
ATTKLNGQLNVAYIRWAVSIPTNDPNLDLLFVITGVIYYMCTGNAPDRLYDQKPEDLETAIPDTYTTTLRELISQCSTKDPETRPSAINIYNLARRVYEDIFTTKTKI